MAKRGRPPNTEDMHTLVNRMLRKKDIMADGKKLSRKDALVEMLWRLVWSSQGKNTTALRALLEYSGGKPVPSNQLPKNEDDKENDDITFIERENFLDKLIAERKAALTKKEKKKSEGDPKGEPSK